MAGIDKFADFPTLKVSQSDISGTWASFRDEFLLSCEMKEVNLGRHEFDNRAKKLALMMSVGEEGRTTLRSLGFNFPTDTFEEGWELLSSHYDREESIFVKTQKFVSVSQAAGEDARDYLLRVERLSRDVEFGRADQTRRRFSLVLAINGLRDTALQQHLMSRENMDWDLLRRILSSRAVAKEASEMLASTSMSSVKQEAVGAVGKYTAPRRNSKDRVSVRNNNSSDDEYYRRDRDNSRYYDRRSPNDYIYQRGELSSGGGRAPVRRDRSRSPRREQSYSPGSRGRQSPGGGSAYSTGNVGRYSPRREYSPAGNSGSWRRNARGGVRPGSPNGNSDSAGKGCHRCGKEGHYKNMCPEIECHRCLQRGHIARDCGEQRCQLCRGIGHHQDLCGNLISCRDRSPTPEREKKVRIVRAISSDSQ